MIAVKFLVFFIVAMVMVYIVSMFFVNLGVRAWRKISSIREERQDLARRETLLLETATKVEQLLRATDERVKELKSLEK